MKHNTLHLLWLKKYIARILQSRTISQIILRAYKRRVPHRGALIDIPEGVNPFIASSLFFHLYESAEIRMIRKHLSTNFPVIEFGSSIGGVSCEISRKLAGKQKLVCIEANPTLIDCLKSNLTRNSHGTVFSVTNALACGTESTTGSFQVSENSLISKHIEGRSDLKINTVDIQRIITENNITAFSLICDVEGAEVDIFQTPCAGFDHCNLLIIELHEVTRKDITYFFSDLVAMIKTNTNLELIEQYGSVFVFARSLNSPKDKEATISHGR